MRRLLLSLLLLISWCTYTAAQKVKILGTATQSQSVITAGIASTTKAARTFPGCTVAIWATGTTTPLQIYSDSIGTPKSNPFTADNFANYDFFIDPGVVFDVNFSGTGVTTPFTRVGFSAPISTGLNPPNANYALRWTNVSQTLDFGIFWPDNTLDLGKFFWEFWCKPSASAQYLISDGFGGAHAVLFGFNGASSGTIGMSGNVWNGSSGTSFASDLGPQVGEWADVAVGYDTTAISIYYDGVPISVTPFTGPRKTFGSTGGGSNLFIGGSDHQNFIGLLGQVRGWDGTNPLTPYSDGVTFIPKPYRPETFLSAYMVLAAIPPSPRATLLASLLHPQVQVPNFVGSEVGRLRNLSQGITANVGEQFPMQQYEVDLTAPSYSSSVAPTPPATAQPTPPTTPANARVFDSFTRQNSTLAFSGLGGLGSTETGSAGVKTWNLGTPFLGSLGAGNFGILADMAVDLVGVPEVAWVTSVGTADMTVLVDRRTQSNAGINTGIAFRVQDQNNFNYAYTSGTTAGSTTLHVGSVVAGVQTDSGTTPAMPGSWTTLKVVCSGSTITVFGDATSVTTKTITNFSTQQGAGIWNQFQQAGYPAKWDNFTVL